MQPFRWLIDVLMLAFVIAAVIMIGPVAQLTFEGPKTAIS